MKSTNILVIVLGLTGLAIEIGRKLLGQSNDLVLQFIAFATTLAGLGMQIHELRKDQIPETADLISINFFFVEVVPRGRKYGKFVRARAWILFFIIGVVFVTSAMILSNLIMGLFGVVSFLISLVGFILWFGDWIG